MRQKKLAAPTIYRPCSHVRKQNRILYLLGLAEESQKRTTSCWQHTVAPHLLFCFYHPFPTPGSPKSKSEIWALISSCVEKIKGLHLFGVFTCHLSNWGKNDLFSTYLPGLLWNLVSYIEQLWCTSNHAGHFKDVNSNYHNSLLMVGISFLVLWIRKLKFRKEKASPPNYRGSWMAGLVRRLYPKDNVEELNRKMWGQIQVLKDLTDTNVECGLEGENLGAWKMERRGAIITECIAIWKHFLYPFYYLSLTRTLWNREEDMIITIFEYGICSLKIV